MTISNRLLQQLKNNEKIIVVNESGKPQYIVTKYNDFEVQKTAETSENKQTIPSPVESQEKGLTSDELLDRINKDIAQLKEIQIPGLLGEGYNYPDDTMLSSELLEEDEDRLYIEEIDESPVQAI